MGQQLADKKLLLIISGGIAAYKSLDLIRKLKEEGATVRCILTDGGAKFITPLSVSALSGEPVFTNLFSPDEEERLGHIRLSRESDLIIVAPASANMLAKMAHGLADNLASAVLLASNKPVLIAPAMNSQMWQHPATQTNIGTLASRGVKQIGPASGMLACGEEGAGRMSEPEAIVNAVMAHFATTQEHLPLIGKKALVTSGPTYEPLDPVRFLGNRSSGKQGHAIAEALMALGASVTLVTGPTTLKNPTGLKTLPIETAREMLEACLSVGKVDIAVCAAAVADWRPQTTADSKIKKDPSATASPQITLVENPDILATLAAPSPNRPALVIGFAAETDNVMEHATHKFQRKGCDWLLANQVGRGQTFGQDDNQVTLLKRDASGQITQEVWPRASKQDVAGKLAAAISAHFKAKAPQP